MGELSHIYDMCTVIPISSHFLFLLFFRTWKNVQLGDALIQHLENEGLKMAQEKQDYFGK